MAPQQDQDEKDLDEISMTASVSNEEDSHEHDKPYIPPPPPPSMITTTSPTSTPRQRYDLTHMDSAAEYSIGSSEASLQMAQYLDDVESSGAGVGHAVDICSFQDVNLDEDDHFAGGGHEGNDVRRARKRYYLLPMLIRYSLPIGGCLIAFLMLVVTVAVTASVVRRQERGAVVHSTVFPGDKAPAGYESVGGWDDDAAGMGEESVGDWKENFPQEDVGEESVGDDNLIFSTYDDAPGNDDVAADYAANDDLLAGEEDVGEPLSFSTNDDQIQIDRDNSTTFDVNTDSASASSTAGSNTSNGSSSSTSSSPNPKWYSTSHPTYLSLLQFHSSTSTTVSPHHTAALFCDEMKQHLCSYATYCPSGKYADPYNGGPSGLFSQAQKEWEQWSPVNTHGQGVEWVQVGKIVDAEDEYWGRCWRYDEWTRGMDMEMTVAAEHRRYILCCDSVQI